MAQVPVEALLTIDDLPRDRLANLGTQFALVDHNVLLDMFRSRPQDPADAEDDARVVAILDHHVDERKHLAANPRTVELIGSCASLVTEHFYPSSAERSGAAQPERIPTPLADLLLSAIVIDTRLKPSADGGKAAEVDLAAVQTLLPASSFASALAVNASSTSESSSSSSALDNLRAFNSRLSDAKEDVAHLSGHDLLRRDYKEYHEASVRYGLSTVPLSLSTWLSNFDQPEEQAVETLVQEVRDWMDERDLALAGVLTSYTHIKKSGAAGSRRREILVVARGAQADGSLAKLEQVFAGLEKDKVLELEEWKAKKTYGIDEGSNTGQQGAHDGWERWKVWQQGNARATRKQVAPALKDLVHGAFSHE